MDPLGADPAPGDPHEARLLAAQLRGRADGVDRVADRLLGTTVAQWAGRAADGFGLAAAQLPQELRRAAAACRQTAQALDGYADALAAARGRAEVLRRRADDAALRLARADGQAPSPAGPVEPGGPDPLGALAARQRQAAAADLAEARREALAVAAELDGEGRVAARRVLDACAEAPVRGPGGRGWVWPVTGVDDVDDGPLGAVRERAEGLGALSEGLAVAGLVVGVAALFPVGLPLGAVAAGITLAGAGLDVLLVSAGEKEPETLALTALAVGTLGASRVLSAPTSLAPRLGRFSVAGSRVEAGLPLTPEGHAPRVWHTGVELAERELVLRSVKFAVETPAAVAAGVVGVQGGRALWARATGGRAPEGRRGSPPEGRRPRDERVAVGVP